MLDTLLETFGKQTSVGQSRTATTNPMQWTLAIVLLGIIVLAFAHVATWMMVFFACCFALVLAVLGYVFIYLTHVDRDALRSERYALDKLAIQTRLTGDSDAGMLTVPDLPVLARSLDSMSLDAPQLLNAPVESTEAPQA